MENLNEAFAVLKVKYGNHAKAADALGVRVCHYANVRKTGKCSRAMKTLIFILADMAKKEMEGTTCQS